MRFPQAARQVPGSVVEEPRRPAEFGRQRKGLRLGSRRLRSALITAGLPIAVVAIVWTVFSAGGTQDVTERESTDARPSVVDSSLDKGSALTEPAPEGAPTSTPAPLGSTLRRRSYALELPELEGFPPDAGQGTRLELWVAWEPPITESPRMQQLLDDVIVERVVAPITPEQPATVILSIPKQRVADILYADRWGALAVTIPPQSP